MPTLTALTWDIHCHVIDNLGDAGVCWRLAVNLAAQGQRVRLVIDDAAPLAFMAPQGAPGVTVHAWPGPPDAPGDVVIEAFGCDLPPERVAAMAAQAQAPIWLNVEYLSAESYVKRSHGLLSPQRNGLRKWFFYPGFTARTGGLLREAGLIEARQAFDRQAWLASQGLTHTDGERVVTLFCYDNPAIPALLASLSEQPTLMLLTPGYAQSAVAAAVAAQPLPPGLRTHALPWLDHAGFDRLLWASDLNFVRGEDSLVRAVWAGAPFVWQPYPQHDGAHFQKLSALLARLQLPPAAAALWRAWNSQPGVAWPGLPAESHWLEWQRQALAASEGLRAHDDLATQLRAFVAPRLKGN